MGSVDGAFEKDRIKKVAGEGNSRDFTYFMLGGARFVYASAVRLALIKVSNIFFPLCLVVINETLTGNNSSWRV